jgi:flagellar hook-basal body complex protein FliE
MNPLSITVTPSQAADAYRATSDAPSGAASGGDFGSTLSRAISGVIDTNHAAEDQAMQAIAGGGNLTDVVTAVSKAQLALQTATTIRDRMVQAYQQIMQMPI